MKNLSVLILILAMVFVMVRPNRVRAQEEEIPPSRLKALADMGWDKSANLRALVEAQNHVTLSKEDACKVLKAKLPRTATAVENAAIERWGIQLLELNDGYVKINNFIKAPGAAPVIGRFAPLAFVWLMINMNLLIDDTLEDFLVQDYMANGLSEAQAKDAANDITDTIRTTFEDPTCFIASPCLGDMLNEIERIKEHRIPREPRHHVFLPVGDDFPGFGSLIGPPCGGAGQLFDPYTPLPVGPPSPPGSNGTTGPPVTGSIDVTASPLPCLR